MNGLNVANEPHDQIFALIKAMDDRVSLLVVDPATEQHFRQRDVIVDGHMKQVLRVTCPDVNPTPAAVAVAMATDSGIYSKVKVKSTDLSIASYITLIS